MTDQNEYDEFLQVLANIRGASAQVKRRLNHAYNVGVPAHDALRLVKSALALLAEAEDVLWVMAMQKEMTE